MTQPIDVRYLDVGLGMQPEGIHAYVLRKKNRIHYELKTTNTPAENAAGIAAAIADAKTRFGSAAEVEVTPGAIDSPVQTAGLREFEVLGSGELDASSMSATATGIVRNNGSLGTEEYALKADASSGATSLQFEASIIAAAALADEMWLHVSRNTGEQPFAPSPKGEFQRIDIDGVETAGTTTTVHLDEKLLFDYPTSDGAKVQVALLSPRFTGTNIKVIGTGQAHTTVDIDGDYGIVGNWCERFELDRGHAYFAERNGVRISHCVEGFTQDGYALHSKPIHGGQIQYCRADIGTGRRIVHRNFKSDNGRHAGAHSGGFGYLQLLIEDGCVAINTYAAAYSEHDSLLERISRHCLTRWCGNGWDYRGRGSRINIGPRIFDTVISHPLYGGVGSAPARGAAFLLVDNAGNIQIIDARGSGLDYILYSLNEVGDSNYAYRNAAPGSITIRGGEFDGFTNGIFVKHTGAENTEYEPGTFNVTPVGPITVDGTKLTCSGKPATPTTSVRPLSFEGYVGRVSIKDVDVEFPAGVASYYALLSLGVTETIVNGGTWKGTRGILAGSKGGAIDGSGNPVTIAPNPGYLTVIGKPALINHDPAFSFINGTIPATLNVQVGEVELITDEYGAGESGNWIKRADITRVRVRMWGGGGAGAGGPKVAAGASCGGGGGGGGGEYLELWLEADQLGDTVAYSVGSGGNSGNGATVLGAGADGGAGGNVIFGDYTAYGGGGGAGTGAGSNVGGGGGAGRRSAGGSTTGTTRGAAGAGGGAEGGDVSTPLSAGADNFYLGCGAGGGGASGTTGLPGKGGVAINGGGCGGGAGGGFDAFNNAQNGAAAQDPRSAADISGGVAPGGNGVFGGAYVGGSARGGSGGAANVAGNGGQGGTGGQRAGGGGGGGASQAGNGGEGGQGGSPYLIVESYFD